MCTLQGVNDDPAGLRMESGLGFAESWELAALLQIAHQVLPNFVVGLLEALAITLSQNAHGVSNSFGNTLVRTICTCTL